jgi:DNA-directed RNA polymerase specialized sigma subunit
MQERLKEAIRSLSEAEQLNTTFYYYEGLTTEEITFLLGRTESVVHQIHASAISQLLAKLQL